MFTAPSFIHPQFWFNVIIIVIIIIIITFVLSINTHYLKISPLFSFASFFLLFLGHFDFFFPVETCAPSGSKPFAGILLFLFSFFFLTELTHSLTHYNTQMKGKL